MTSPTPTVAAPGSGGTSRPALAGVLLALAVGTFLAFRTTREGSILGNADRLLLEIMAFWAAWAIALALLLRLRQLSGRRLLLLVVLGAVALRVAAMTIVVPLSDDVYRYAWDGQVQASGTSPYRYAPTADELRDLRTDWLWPTDEQCEQRDREPACSLINRQDVRTIYPPLAQLWFLGGHLAGASQLRDIGWQGVALVADVGTCVLLWSLLVRRGRDPRWVAAFAWSPVAVLEGVQNAHVDGLATFFVVAAVALAGRRPAASGAVLAVATLVKLYPALLLPVLLGRRPVRVVTAFVAVVVAGYVPHLIPLGRDVLGYLPGYLQEEDYAAGTRYLLLAPLGLPGPVATGIVGLLALAVAAVVLRTARRLGPAPPGDLAPAACLLFGSALLLASPVQPWYGLPLAALAALCARPAWFAVPAAAYPVFFAVVPDGPSVQSARIGSACFLAALAVVLLARLRCSALASGQPEGPAADAAGPSDRAGASATTRGPRR